MKPTALLACAGAVLVTGCATAPPAERGYVDAEAQRMTQRPAGVLVAGCVVTPVSAGDAVLTDASKRLATAFGHSLNRELASAGRIVTKTDTPTVCLGAGPPPATDQAGVYKRLLSALADVKKAHVYSSFGDLMLSAPGELRERVDEPTARWPLVLDEADARQLWTEFRTTDLWVLRAAGRSVDQLANFASDMVVGVLAALAGSNTAPAASKKNEVRYEVALVDLERREVVWMKLGRPYQLNPETVDIVADDRFARLLEPFVEAAPASAGAPQAAPLEVHKQQ
jgi:hypothetical protein